MVRRKPDFRALGRLKSGAMNKTEAAYASHLEGQRLTGAILWYAFEPIKLRLADATFYEPDFGVLQADGLFAMHEVKGARAIFQDDARVKIKVAASLHPFRFVAVYPLPKARGGGWEFEEF